MATSAFKSTSRRGTNGAGSDSNNSFKKSAGMRRSHSVSSLSRAHLPQSDVSSEFLNKRDNPLFWSNGGGGSPPEPENSVAVLAHNVAKTSSADGQRSRGRSVNRNSDLVNKKVVSGGRKEVAGRSLSKVDAGRRGRSLSRCRYAASESEVGESLVSSNYPNRSSVNVAANSLKRCVIGKSVADTQRVPAKNQAIEPSDNSASYLIRPNGEDAVSTGSLTEAEEKTIRAVCEQMKGDHVGGVDTSANGIYETVRSEVRRAILDIQNDLGSAVRRNNPRAIAATNIADIPPDLVNPGAVELVSDIRKEYAKKLDESQERASELRVDLAVEERRGQELSRILKEILPDPKTTNVQKSRPGRKKSNERKKMSKRLTEEAMTYFDECVSISTFDSSDFSATEDPPLNLVGASTPMGPTASFGQDSSSFSTTYWPHSCLNNKQDSGGHGLLVHSHMDSKLTAGSSNEPVMNQANLRNDEEWGCKSRFSLSQKPTENVGFRQDIGSYIKNIESEIAESGIYLENSRANNDYDLDQYTHGRGESLLSEMVLSKNRTECGSLHLCGGGLAISFSPFASVI